MTSKSSHIKHKINITSYNIILPDPPTISTPHGDYNLPKETHQMVPQEKPTTSPVSPPPIRGATPPTAGVSPPTGGALDEAP